MAQGLGVGIVLLGAVWVCIPKPVGWQPQATMEWVVPVSPQMLRQPNQSLVVRANTRTTVKDLPGMD